MRLSSLLFISFVLVCSSSCTQKLVRQSASSASLESPWSAVDNVIEGYVKSGVLSNVQFEVYNSKYEKLYEFRSGQFDPDQEISILSASKWISTSVIMTLVDQGLVGLDDKIQKYIKQRDGKDLNPPVSEITLRQLLSMTSGLNEAHPCYGDYTIGLKECVDQILESAASTIKPGSEFRYGDAHLTVAGYIAITVAKKNWQSLFDQALRKTLEMTSKAEYYAKPKSLKGALNPRPAAGLRISYADYLKFVHMIYDYGVYHGVQVLKKKSILEMEKNQLTGDIIIGKSTFQDLGLRASYGLGQWLECKSSLCDRVSISSPGFYGFYPWLDRESKYYALFGAMEPNPVFDDVIKMQSRLKPLIEAAIKNEK